MANHSMLWSPESNGYPTFGVSQSRELLATVDGKIESVTKSTNKKITITLVKTDAKEEPGQNSGASKGPEKFVYRVSKHASINVALQVGPGQEVARGQTLAQIEGRRFCPTVVFVQYLRGEGKEEEFVPCPGEVKRFASQGEATLQVRCVGCHNPTLQYDENENRKGPPGFKGFAKTTHTAATVKKVLLDGSAGMPSFEGVLEDSEIEAVTEYVLTL